MYHETEIVAEVKTCFSFERTATRSWDKLCTIAEYAGDIISVHTDARWSGSLELVHHARERSAKPILVRGIMRMTRISRQHSMRELIGACRHRCT